ncbi:MAG: FecR domain-containing protein [Limisphaerales bacterium]
MKAPPGAIYLSALLISTIGSAADLKQSRFTQVVNDVRILEMPTRQAKRAAVDEIFKAPDVIRTGPASRAELVAEDKTITRIGANSIFSFDPANRTINLEQGSLLFQAPKGKGGGTIRTTSAVASVLGTTMIVSSTEDGGFKVLLLEGTGRVTLPNGRSMTLKAGQMIFVLPNGGGFSPVINFKLEDQVKGSQLVTGFQNPLPSMDLIDLHITRQNKLIANGQAVDTGLLVGDSATLNSVQVVDANLLQQRFEQVINPPDSGHVPNPSPNPGPGPGPTNPPPHINFDVVIGSEIVKDASITLVPETGYLLQGNNIRVDGGTINMSAVGDYPTFVINAQNVLQFANSDLRTDFRTPEFVNVSAEFQYLYLVADEFIFPANYGITFNGVYLHLDDRSDMTLSLPEGTALRIANINNSGHLGMGANGNLTLSGNLHLHGYHVSLYAGNNLTVDGGFFGASSSGTMQAENQLTLRNVRFEGGAEYLNLSARTIALENITFPSSSFVHLFSENGQLAPNPNTGAAVQPGYVNFVRNVNYGSIPAENAINSGIYIFSNSSSSPNRR